ncbi:beta-lactamase class C [Luteimonas cucumeris]|uniref:Beta-lactamase class C n=1 Tax=Luteimonas cucumeris TaxID=985012 RepID=A0A562LFB4_9GAMM|nr:beta-lactamase class C [Luteimonas cucumeris]
MKGKRLGPHRRTWRVGLVSLLLPLALVSAAQTPLRWEGPQPAAATPATLAPTQNEQPLAPATPVSRRSAQPLASGFDVRQFEAIAQELVADQRIPGLALAIVQDGRVLSARGYGVTDVSAAEPVDAHTVFRLASLSKSFAGTITGMLVSEGALRWDSKLTDYMPDFRLASPGAAQQLNVADLLSHRVGLTHNAYDRDIERNAEYRDLVRKLAEAPMKCMPGDCYAYQNVAFSMIGDIVFAATGQFYSETVQRRIFKPLGMNDASYGLEGIEASARWARPHVRARGGWVSLMPKPTYYRMPPAAGVNASISDMAQWLIAQSGHRPDVLPAPLLATLHAPLIETPGEIRGSSWRRERVDSASYALGWRVYDYAGHEVVFHAGAVQGYRGMMALLPDRDLGIAILWNSESSLPSGLLPTILDRAIGLPMVAWVDTPAASQRAAETMMAGTPATTAGMDATTSEASPK